MIADDIKNAKDILAIAEIFKKENKEELLMLVAAATKLEETRILLDGEKQKYKKSFYPILQKNFRACLLFLSLALILLGGIYIPAHFSIEFGSFKIEKSQICNKN